MINAILHLFLCAFGWACHFIGVAALLVCWLTGQWLIVVWAVAEIILSAWFATRMYGHFTHSVGKPKNPKRITPAAEWRERAEAIKQTWEIPAPGLPQRAIMLGVQESFYRPAQSP